ncbi:MAG: undecaprenyl diphosphate synthase family protein [Nitrospirae bacterium]|nr:undecaprenyl diphosphate synthase family protein [Nitrospirota bacterium]
MKYFIDSFYSVQIAHIGLIPDGTRRWSNREGIAFYDGYVHAMHKLIEIMRYCFKEDFCTISVYLSSIQNFKRSESEITAFCKAEALLCNELLISLADELNVKVKLSGKLSILPDYFKEALKIIEKKTEQNYLRNIYLLVAYNPLEEIIDAFQKTNINENFIDHLWVTQPLDLVIRTSGVTLLSNFLPLQSGYARLYTIDKLFNDTDITDYRRIISEFKGIERVFGE